MKQLNYIGIISPKLTMMFDIKKLKRTVQMTL